MAERQPDYEVQQRKLEGDWVEMRIVYETAVAPDRREYHLLGSDARLGAVQWVLSFAGSLADNSRAYSLAAAIARLWDHIHSRNCSCTETHH